MFQDIDPHKITYDNTRNEPSERDHVLFLKDGRVLLEAREGRLALPTYGRIHQVPQGKNCEIVYLFSIDAIAYYYSLNEIDEISPFIYTNISVVRNLQPSLLAFASATAFHIAVWYASNRYCGQCAAALRPKEKERALHCPGCGLVKYPRISPVIIVGIRDGESLLLAKNAGGEYKNYGLIAGFVEPGETLEMAIAREVMEEVGLRIKNARYYKSQPWAFSQSLLMGFFADLQGERTITLDTVELSEAGWFCRSDIPVDNTRFSLTWDMIQAFRNGEA